MTGMCSSSRTGWAGVWINRMPFYLCAETNQTTLYMKTVLCFLLVGSLLTATACQTKPKTEEAGVNDTATMSTDTTMMSDSASSMTSDTAK